MNRKTYAYAWLTLAAALFGATFVVVKDALDFMLPPRTAIILAFEPLFAVVTAAIVLQERLTTRGWIGAALMIAGTYVVLVFAPPEDADMRTAEAMSEAH